MKKYLALALTVLLLNLSLASVVPAQTSGNKAAKQAAKMKADIEKRGINAPVDVELVDGHRVKGRIKEIKADSFVVVNTYGTSTEIQYTDASKPKKQFPLAAKVALGIVIGFGVILGITYAACKTHGCD